VQVSRLEGHDETVWSLAWRPNRSFPQLASCGTDRIVRLWGEVAGTWRLLTEIDATSRHTRTLRCAAWDPSGDVLAVTSFDSTTSLWKEVPTDEGELNFEYAGVVAGHENEVKCAAFSPSGEFLATCSRDKSVWIFETEDKGFEYECVALLQSHTQDVKFVCWHPSQDVLFSCSYDDTIKVWAPDGDDWSCKQTLTGHTSTVWSMAFDAVGSRFVTCSDDRSVRVWAPGAAPETAGTSSSSTGGYNPKTALKVTAAAYLSPMYRWGSLLPGASKAPTAQTKVAPKDAAGPWHCICNISDVHPRPVYFVDWLPSQETFATACGDNLLRVFELSSAASEDEEDWRCVAQVRAHEGDANCVAWRGTEVKGEVISSAMLATCGDDGVVGIWRYRCS